jgi:hypothetical protein
MTKVQARHDMMEVARKDFPTVGWSRARPACRMLNCSLNHAPLNVNLMAANGGEYDIQLVVM